MKISDAVQRLEAIRIKHGDVEVEFDCPNCKQSFHPNKIVIGPITAKLSDTEYSKYK